MEGYETPDVHVNLLPFAKEARDRTHDGGNTEGPHCMSTVRLNETVINHVLAKQTRCCHIHQLCLVQKTKTEAFTFLHDGDLGRPGRWFTALGTPPVSTTGLTVIVVDLICALFFSSHKRLLLAL